MTISTVDIGVFPGGPTDMDRYRDPTAPMVTVHTRQHGGTAAVQMPQSR